MRNNNVVNPLRPHVKRHLGLSQTRMTWIFLASPRPNRIFPKVVRWTRAELNQNLRGVNQFTSIVQEFVFDLGIARERLMKLGTLYIRTLHPCRLRLRSACLFSCDRYWSRFRRLRIDEFIEIFRVECTRICPQIVLSSSHRPTFPKQLQSTRALLAIYHDTVYKERKTFLLLRVNLQF